MTDQNKKNDKKQQLKKYAVFAIMFLIFAICMWLIFAPSKSDQEAEAQNSGFNAELPNPKGKIFDDKRTAYEQESFRQKQEERMKTLNEYSFILENDNQDNQSDKQTETFSASTQTSKSSGSGYRNRSSDQRTRFESSSAAYQDINATLGNFYTTPQEDPEKKALEEKIEQLENMIVQQQKPDDVETQLKLMEKSYELAAKYAPAQGQLMPTEAEKETDTGKKTKNDKVQVSPVGLVSEHIVSALIQPMSDGEFIRQMSVERNVGFYSVDNANQNVDKNTISAVIHATKKVINGESIQLRLTEPLKVDNLIIPKNYIITGNVSIQGERLNVLISQIDFMGKVIKVNIAVIDTDGQQGIFIPGSMEMNAFKEVVANMSGNMGSSINITQTSAGDQLLTDLGRGVIQGTSQYVAKKVRQITVTLKAGYNLLLLPINE